MPERRWWRGARQCGKTTLARQLVPVASANSFDLEDPISQGTVVIDEVQHRPELFQILRVLPLRALVVRGCPPGRGGPSSGRRCHTSKVGPRAD